MIEIIESYANGVTVYFNESWQGFEVCAEGKPSAIYFAKDKADACKTARFTSDALDSNPQTTADKLESVSTRPLMDLILLVETRNGTTNLRIASLNEYERLGRHATTLLEVPFDVEMNSCAAQDRVLSDLGGLAKIIGG